jgi:hypothetical protein
MVWLTFTLTFVCEIASLSQVLAFYKHSSLLCQSNSDDKEVFEKHFVSTVLIFVDQLTVD